MLNSKTYVLNLSQIQKSLNLVNQFFLPNLFQPHNCLRYVTEAPPVTLTILYHLSIQKFMKIVYTSSTKCPDTSLLNVISSPIFQIANDIEI